MSKRKKIKKNLKRYEIAKLPKNMAEVVSPRLPSHEVGICDNAEEKINDALVRGCTRSNRFVIQSGRPCTKGGGATAPVDLVVVMDTSGSMNLEASDLSDAAEEAISKAKKSCPSQLRVVWLGIEGTWPGTKFTQSYRDYLHNIGVPATTVFVGTLNDQEDGAAAIIDLSVHFDWRPGTSKNIFYLGDEALEGGDPHLEGPDVPDEHNDVVAANSAIKAANNNNVKVFTYAGTGVPPISEYERVATATGGSFFKAPASNLGGFQAILEKIICASKEEGGCRPVEVPSIRPCFQLQWGQGPKDHMETDDVEFLCITAMNQYSNVTFKNLKVLLTMVTDDDGTAVATLPDGTPSVLVKPTYMICFGDVPPCDPDKPDEFSRISREAVLITRGAKEGKYRILIAYCYSVEFTISDVDKFEIELVKS